MKVREEVTEEVTRKRLVKRVCDLCGAEAKKADWDAGIWEVNETEVKVKVYQREGDSFPEGGSGTEFEVDICPDCFKNRLVPWLREQGAEIEEGEWDW